MAGTQRGQGGYRGEPELGLISHCIKELCFCPERSGKLYVDFNQGWMVAMMLSDLHFEECYH